MKKKNSKKIPPGKIMDEDNLENTRSVEKSGVEADHMVKSNQKILDEWKDGKIICRKWFFPEEKDTEMV